MIIFETTLKMIPTVHHQIMAGHELRIRRSKKHHRIRYMLRFQHPFQTVMRLKSLLRSLHSHADCLARQRSRHRPWRHTVHTYPMPTQLIASAFHQRYHPALGHDIVCMHVPYNTRNGACCANDAAFHTSFHHRTRRVLQARCYTTNVYGEEFVVGVQVKVQNSLLAKAHDACIAEYDVELTVELNSRLHKGFDLVFIRDVAVDVGGSVGSDGFCEILAFFILDISDHHSSGAILDEGKHCNLANATGTSGDDGNLILNFVLARFGVRHCTQNETDRLQRYLECMSNTRGPNTFFNIY
ncbi:hypothetical protein OIU76_022430 [Salix suchowensis]|nr:hypothetical protein OIU76_022430 [Salix suchowensis]